MLDLNEGTSRDLTVAQVRLKENSGAAEVLFLESARIYRLPKAHARFDFFLAILHAAMKRGKPVTITTAAPDSDVLESVTEGTGTASEQRGQ